MNSLLTYSLHYTGYDLINKSNMFNTLLFIFDSLIPEDKKQEFVKIIKLYMGMGFYHKFIQYTVRKDPHHKIISI